MFYVNKNTLILFSYVIRLDNWKFKNFETFSNHSKSFDDKQQLSDDSKKHETW